MFALVGRDHICRTLASVLASSVFALGGAACSGHRGGHPWPPDPVDQAWMEAWHEYAQTYRGPTTCEWSPLSIGPPLVASPASFSRSYMMGAGSHDFLIANVGAADVTITKVALYQCFNAGWAATEAVPAAQRWISLQESNCEGQILAPGESCTVTISFAYHVVKAKLEIEDASGVILEIPLALHP